MGDRRAVSTCYNVISPFEWPEMAELASDAAEQCAAAARAVAGAAAVDASDFVQTTQAKDHETGQKHEKHLWEEQKHEKHLWEEQLGRSSSRLQENQILLVQS